MAYELIGNGGAAATLDDIVRRKLRVGNPNNAEEVAKALLALYPDEKGRLDREAVGLPFTFADSYAATVLPAAQTVSPFESDFNQATADLDQDLNLLVNEPALRNVAPGLRGWAQAIRSSISEGIAAARSSLDPAQRDKVFSVRRTLTDYARLSRYVGVLNIESFYKYRRLARSIDQVSSLIFVQMGEAISQQAMSGFLMQVSLTEIQSRRAGVINSLRNLLGSLEATYDDETWGRGRIGYRQLYQEIVAWGQPDLRVLLQETELSRIMSDLVDQAARNNEDGNFALGATSAVILEKMQRLLLIGGSLSHQQPPLVAFLESLQLFVDSFIDTRLGLRLVDVAKPPITFYGSRYAFGTGNVDSGARKTLVQLTFARGRLADALDDYLQDDFSNKQIIGQIILDKVLSDVDRAIDLYVQGNEDWGPAENRAYAYGFLLRDLINGTAVNFPTNIRPLPIWGNIFHKGSNPPPNYVSLDTVLEYRDELKKILQEIEAELCNGGTPVYSLAIEELVSRQQEEQGWLQLVQSVVPSNFP